jgi:hypothetical protein
MAEKLYTLAEANALLAHLAPALTELRDVSDEVDEIRERIAQISATNGWAPTKTDWAKKLARVAELLERVEAWSIVLRDITIGLVDFPTLIGGEPAFYCWKLGEETVGHWHRPDEGLAGRRPL